MTLTDVAPLLGRLPAVLDWVEEGTGVVADALSTHRRRLDEAMWSMLRRVDELARSSDPGVRSATLRALAPAWAGADDQARRRVTLAPATSRRLLWAWQRPHDAARWITMGLAYEAAAAASSGVLLRGLWSALGDAHVGAGPLPGVSAPTPLPSGVGGRPGDRVTASALRPAPHYVAPVIGSGIPVDAWSPLARTVHMTRTGGVAGAWPEFDEASLRQVTAHLEGALAGLRATSGVAAALVETFTRVVVVRGPGRGFGHGSTVVDLGRTVVMDPLASCATPARLTEALLHEAMHHLCNVTVRDAIWVQGEGGAVIVESPWTGNPLPLTTYLQACLVWGGLRNFWRQAEARDSFARGARERLAAAEHGFGAGPLLDRIPQSVRSRVHPLVAEAVAHLERP